VHLEELGYLFYFNQQSEYTFYKLMFWISNGMMRYLQNVISYNSHTA
jgi:hypothetical protein